MNTTLKTAAIAFLMAICMASCTNAEAQVIELTSETFNTLVYNTKADESAYLGKTPAVVDFYATWCGPCQRISPILKELSEEYKGQVTIYKVDVDKCKDIAERFNVRSIPAVMYIPMDSEPVMTIGARNKARFKEEIEKILLKKE